MHRRGERPYPVACIARKAGDLHHNPNHETEKKMPSRAKTRIALAGGAVVVALAAGVGGGVLSSNTAPSTQLATPTSSVAPTPPPPTAPINNDREGAIGNPPDCVEPYCGVLLNPPPR